MQQDRQQPASGAARVKELTPAEAEKESGNDAFKKSNYEEVGPAHPLSGRLFLGESVLSCISVCSRGKSCE